LMVAGSAIEVSGAREFAHAATASAVARIQIAQWLKKSAPSGATIAAFDIGIIAYESGLRVLDTGGLTDVPIARLIHDGPAEYTGLLVYPRDAALAAVTHETLSREPELIMLLMYGEVPELVAHAPVHKGRFRAIRNWASYPQDYSLLSDPDFGHAYR